VGGKAGPQYGCAGDGYRIARRLGHAVVSPLPALAPLVCDARCADRLAALKGIRAKGKAALWIGEEKTAEETGEIQFTADGLSGICVFDLSRHLRNREARVCRVILDLAPEYDEAELESLLSEGRAAALRGIVHAGLAARVAADTAGDARAAAREIKAMEFPVAGTKGWREAQTSSGGVRADMVDAATMESRIAQGLYFAGEILDYDGRCGGYNLHWAWTSGMRAGRAAAASVARPAPRTGGQG
jgi:predicted Rossmann fold flavoprotein